MITLKKSLPSQLQSCSRLDFLGHQWRPLQLVPANLRSGYLPLTLGHGHYGWHRWKQRPQYAAKPGVFLQSVADMIHHLQCYLHVYTCSSDWARNGGDSHPSHSATQPLWQAAAATQPLSQSGSSHSARKFGCSSHSARVAEWLSGWARVALTRVAEWLSGCGSHSARVAEGSSIHTQLKPPQNFHYTHCLWHDVAASEFVLAASDSLFFAGFVSRWC